MLGKEQILVDSKMETISCILFDHNGIKLEINSKRNSRNYTNTWN